MVIHLFHFLFVEFVEGTARITEARLHREQSEGRIIHYERHGDTGFAVIPRAAFTSDNSRVTIIMHLAIYTLYDSIVA